MKNLWGVEGGDLKRPAQTHAAIGRRFFYFTIAARLPSWWLGVWVRLRVKSQRPFVQVLGGRR